MLLGFLLAFLVVALVVVIAVCCSVLAHETVVRKYGHPPRCVVNIIQPRFVLTGRHPAFREIGQARSILATAQAAAVRQVQKEYEAVD